MKQISTQSSTCCFSETQGSFGKLSLPPEMYPRLVRDLRIFDVASIYAGHDHSGAIDKEGRVFTWGLGRGAQLGQGDDKCEVSPRPNQVETNHFLNACCLCTF